MNDLPLEYLSALKPFKNEVPQGNHSFQVSSLELLKLELSNQVWLITKTFSLPIKLQLVPETQSSCDPVGRPNVHQAALQQATGEAVYYDDIPSVKGELFASMVTSTRAHAKIL